MEAQRKPLILTICNYYLPGFESGGAMRTLVNMVDRLHEDFEFKVITRDHDGPNNLEPYSTVNIGQWNRVGNADVYYLARPDINFGSIRRLVKEVSPDAIYLNSFFSTFSIITLLLRRFGQLGSIPVVLAPEGELIPGGLRLKPVKKRTYLTFAKSLGLLNGVIWKAAADTESDDVERVFGTGQKVFIAPNLPPVNEKVEDTPANNPPKVAGAVSFVFLSRIMRKKNINWFLELLRQADGEISIDIYGPVENDDYFEETKEIISSLPANVSAEIKGAVTHDKVGETLSHYHFFVLPTLGENFGHIYVEAMAAGLPLLTSDRCPWRELEGKGIGWDIPLEQPDRWGEAIDMCVKMSGVEYSERSRTAREFAGAWLSDPALNRSNKEVLDYAVGRNT
jgi:glycosyltransferase involved in cell wall biosynthesis